MRTHSWNKILVCGLIYCISLEEVAVVESFTLSPSSSTRLLSRTASKTKHNNNAVVLKDAVQNIRGEVDDEWKGEVVPGGSMMRGCTIREASSPDDDNAQPCTEFLIRIDGVEADLAAFSGAIYKQMMIEAKQQQFQGFRPGTIPPHLYKTYKAYALDETCRETILEAMAQNNIRPFTNARLDMKIEQISIPPPPSPKKTKKKSKKKKKKKNDSDKDSIVDENTIVKEETEPSSPPTPPQWQVYETMDDAIKAGWSPGQSFSFLATNVKGQSVLSDNATRGAIPLIEESDAFYT